MDNEVVDGEPTTGFHQIQHILDREDQAEADIRKPRKRPNAMGNYRVSKSGFIGVYKAKDGTFKSTVSHKMEVFYVGIFEHKEEAALAYIAKCEEVGKDCERAKKIYYGRLKEETG